MHSVCLQFPSCRSNIICTKPLTSQMAATFIFKLVHTGIDLHLGYMNYCLIFVKPLANWNADIIICCSLRTPPATCTYSMFFMQTRVINMLCCKSCLMITLVVDVAIIAVLFFAFVCVVSHYSCFCCCRCPTHGVCNCFCCGCCAVAYV